MRTTLLIIILLAALLVLLIYIVKTAMDLTLNAGKTKQLKERLKQLDERENKKTSSDKEGDLARIIDKVTAPLSDGVLNEFDYKGLDKLKRKLKVSGWDKYFPNPKQWIALSIILGAIGIFLFVLFATESIAFGLVIGGVVALTPHLLLHNSYAAVNEDVLLHFPEIIRIMGGYLLIGETFRDALLETAEDTTGAWKAKLEKMAELCREGDEMPALQYIIKDIDVLEGREFFRIVELSLETGLRVGEAFTKQADSIQQLLKDAIQKEIERRRIYSILIQFPIFLMIIAAFALPIVGAFMDLNL